MFYSVNLERHHPTDTQIISRSLATRDVICQLYLWFVGPLLALVKFIQFACCFCLFFFFTFCHSWAQAATLKPALHAVVVCKRYHHWYWWNHWWKQVWKLNLRPSKSNILLLLVVLFCSFANAVRQNSMLNAVLVTVMLRRKRWPRVKAVIYYQEFSYVTWLCKSACWPKAPTHTDWNKWDEFCIIHSTKISQALSRAEPRIDFYFRPSMRLIPRSAPVP